MTRPEPPMNHNNGVTLGPGLRLTARGPLVIGVLAVLAIIGSNLYAGYRLEESLRASMAHLAMEHHVMTRANEQTACMVALSPEDREHFRIEYRPGAWSRWCPWIKE